MISGGTDGILRVWGSENNELRFEHRGQGDAIVHLVGGQDRLAVASIIKKGGQLLEIWDLEDLVEVSISN